MQMARCEIQSDVCGNLQINKQKQGSTQVILKECQMVFRAVYPVLRSRDVARTSESVIRATSQVHGSRYPARKTIW